MNPIRRQVLEHIVDVVRQAADQGLDGYAAAKRAFPDVPESVIAEAWAEEDQRRVEGWWQQVERTIDAEVIKRAITAPSGGAE